MSDAPALADPSTRFGQLQRGRGAGFLAALRSPDAARDEVLHCVRNDPRIDRQIENRDRYYAELVEVAGVPVDAIVAPLRGRDVPRGEHQLAHAVLAAMFRRGSAQVHELLGDAGTDEPVLDGVVEALGWDGWNDVGALPARAAAVMAARQERDRAFCGQPGMPRGAPPPVDGSMSIADLLEMARGHQHAARKELLAELCRRGSEADRRELARFAEHDDEPARFGVAARVLGMLADSRLLPTAEALFARDDVFEDEARRLPNRDRMRRKAMLDYVRELPPAITLPLARAWHPRDGYFDVVAGSVLAEQAEPEDREWLERFVTGRLSVDTGWSIISELDALARIGDERSAPVFVAVAERAGYSLARRCAMRGLARMPAAPRALELLREGLWDAEDEIAELACSASPSLDESARSRVGGLAADPVVDSTLRAAATARLAAS